MKVFDTWNNKEVEKTSAQFEVAQKLYNGRFTTQKPKDLFVWCLKNYLKDGNIIFDPFLGSFTTAVACNELGLNWIGCELDPSYFKSGSLRYEQETKQILIEF